MCTEGFLSGFCSLRIDVRGKACSTAPVVLKQKSKGTGYITTARAYLQTAASKQRLFSVSTGSASFCTGGILVVLTKAE